MFFFEILNSSKGAIEKQMKIAKKEYCNRRSRHSGVSGYCVVTHKIIIFKVLEYNA